MATKNAERNRLEEQGLQEVRGIFAPPKLHAKIKAEAAKLIKPAEQA
jgi:hypothetical protein